VPVFTSYKSDAALEVAALQEQIQASNDAGLIAKAKELTHGLEISRMFWLLGALIVVVGGLLFAYTRAQKNPIGWGAMKYPQLVLGMLALFVYVGIEVAIGSNLGELLTLEEFGNLQSSQITPYVSMYWGGMMIGRWAGAIAAFNFTSSKKQLLTIIVPVIAFTIIIGVNSLAGFDMSVLYYFIICVAL